MKKTIRERIFEMSDEGYRKFQSKLTPDVDNFLGVRLPLLRMLAKDIAKGDWRGYLHTAEDEYFEEIMLQGMVIGYATADMEEILKYVSEFIPKISNWALCDSFCSGLKITKKHMLQMWGFLRLYLNSQEEFKIRFAVVMLLSFYIQDDYIDQVLSLLDKVRHEGYYVKIAVAWALSVCFIKYPEKTMVYLEKSNLDIFTYNKALQKITESFRVDKEAKDIIRGMKRKY